MGWWELGPGACLHVCTLSGIQTQGYRRYFVGRGMHKAPCMGSFKTEAAECEGNPHGFLEGTMEGSIRECIAG